ncbi:hypothetical protein [Prosthecochloris aestuarii]|uniref:hypothetical protein n=1 Tax=Prosthecochloris aestuarii TaxID=1102 RepID=UPI0012948478|nr:hypothetical protein [Prosthecochloris aestuarii]
MIWNLRLYGDSGGPTSISCAAWLHHGLTPASAPSWHTIIGEAVPIWTQPGTARNVRKQALDGSRQKTGEVRKSGEIGSAR